MAVIQDLRAGDQFIFDNKLHIKTDQTRSLAAFGADLQRLTPFIDHHTCVEFYTGKLVVLKNDTSIEK